MTKTVPATFVEAQYTCQKREKEGEACALLGETSPLRQKEESMPPVMDPVGVWPCSFFASEQGIHAYPYQQWPFREFLGCHYGVSALYVRLLGIKQQEYKGRRQWEIDAEIRSTRYKLFLELNKENWGENYTITKEITLDEKTTVIVCFQ